LRCTSNRRGEVAHVIEFVRRIVGPAVVRLDVSAHLLGGVTCGGDCILYRCRRARCGHRCCRIVQPLDGRYLCLDCLDAIEMTLDRVQFIR